LPSSPPKFDDLDYAHFLIAAQKFLPALLGVPHPPLLPSPVPNPKDPSQSLLAGQEDRDTPFAKALRVALKFVIAIWLTAFYGFVGDLEDFDRW
jgi:hypothetical protein